MKIRTRFISNSSSTSFVISRKDIPLIQLLDLSIYNIFDIVRLMEKGIDFSKDEYSYYVPDYLQLKPKDYQDDYIRLKDLVYKNRNKNPNKNLWITDTMQRDKADNNSLLSKLKRYIEE